MGTEGAGGSVCLWVYVCVRERMEDCSSSISAFCTQLRGCCEHVDASCATLRSAVDQRPSSLPSSNLPSLLTTLINRVSSASQEVGNLESRTIDTISFQELLGHCMEIYKQNETSICMMEDRLKEFGYTPVVEESSNGDLKAPTIPLLSELSLEAKLKTSISADGGSIAGVTEVRKPSSTLSRVNEQLQSYMYDVPGTKDGLSSSFYPETLSLEELGLSAAGLACLAQEEASPGVDYIFSLESLSAKPASQEASPNVLSIDTSGGDIEYPCVPEDNMYLIDRVQEDEYFSCPTWLKIQISLEDLNALVDNMCEVLANKITGGHKQLSLNEDYVLNSEDLSALNVAGTNKLKPCLLFLGRLGRLRTGHENGATVYHVVHQ